jgi:hypothetical protein
LWLNSDVNYVNLLKFILTDFPSRVPSDTWTPVASDRIEYLHMTNDGFKMARGLYEDRMRFVDTLPLLNNQYNLRHEKTEL